MPTLPDQKERERLLGLSLMALARETGIAFSEVEAYRELLANPPTENSVKPKKPRKAPTKGTTPTGKKRKLSHAGAREKGNKWEREFIDVMRACGIPSMRVIASGAWAGADTDVKMGVYLEEDGSYPAPDEARCIYRMEGKNRADNPDYIFTALNAAEGTLFIPAPKGGAEILWAHLNQDAVSKAVFLRRTKVPAGTIENQDWNQLGLVCMGLKDYAELFKLAYSEKLKL